jgi:hypothetical protein
MVAILASLFLNGCAKPVEQTPEYLAACEGPPLRDVGMINQAMEDGYDINRHFRCIDKASFLAKKERHARWLAANTPEAKAKREAEFEALKARGREEQALREANEAKLAALKPLPVVLHKVDVNTAGEAELAEVISIGAQTAAQIVAARKVRRFEHWPDLVRRVISLSAAQPAAFASICGLTVNGKSLAGAAPDATMAAAIRDKYQRH